MIARALSLGEGLVALHEPEPHLLDVGFRAWARSSSSSQLEAEIQKRRHPVMTSVRQDSILVESSNYLSFLVPQLARLYEPRLVHIMRHPRPFVRSGLARGWYKRPALVRTLMRASALATGGSPYPVFQFECHRLAPPPDAGSRAAQIAWLWSEYNNAIADDAAASGAPTFTVTLEDFQAAPEDSLRRLLTFIGSKPQPRLADMVAVAQSRPNASAGKSQEKLHETPWTDQDEQDLNRWAGAAARRFGYSL